MVVDGVVFFANTEMGILVFFTTILLLQKKSAGPLIGKPNIFSLILKATVKSLATGIPPSWLQMSLIPPCSVSYCIEQSMHC